MKYFEFYWFSPPSICCCEKLDSHMQYIAGTVYSVQRLLRWTFAIDCKFNLIQFRWMFWPKVFDRLLVRLGRRNMHVSSCLSNTHTKRVYGNAENIHFRIKIILHDFETSCSEPRWHLVFDLYRLFLILNIIEVCVLWDICIASFRVLRLHICSLCDERTCEVYCRIRWILLKTNSKSSCSTTDFPGGPPP